MAQLLFRGVELRAWNGKIEEGGPVYRLKFLADLGKVAARGLGCEDLFFDGDSLREFDDDVSLSGSRKISQIRLEPNGMKQHTIEIPASDLEWEIYTKQSGDEDEPADCRIRLSVTTGCPFRVIEDYAKVAGTVAGVMKAKLANDAQMKLTQEDEDESEEPGEDEGEESGPALASVAHMERR